MNSVTPYMWHVHSLHILSTTPLTEILEFSRKKVRMKLTESEACRERLEEHLGTVLFSSCEPSQQRRMG